MGLFGKLFDKKSCDFCGGEIGLLGNRKLEDGNMCKECAAKLSPFFSDRKHSTVAEIGEQLRYREENRSAVAAFGTTRTFGKNTKVYIDDNAGKFMVTSSKKLAESNPDVIDLSAVTGCTLDISENHTELTQNVKQADGTTKRVSYNPPRFRYNYNFKIILDVNHPYFDEIRFDLNSGSVSIETVGNMPARVTNPARVPTANSIGNSVLQGLSNAFNSAVNAMDPRMNDPEYREYYEMGCEIKAAFMPGAPAEAGSVTEPAVKTPAQVICPWCDATTTPDANGCCEYCGGKLNG